MAPDWSVVVLAGGRASRMAGMNKAELTIGGVSNLDRILVSLPAEVPVVVVGPAVETVREVHWCREVPVYGGPVAGLAAALSSGLLQGSRVVLLAVDMPHAGEIASTLAETCDDDVDAVLAVDANEANQSLCACYRTDALRAAISALNSPEGASMRALIAPLRTRSLTLPPDLAARIFDIDTPEDMLTARSRSEGSSQVLEDWVKAVSAELNVDATRVDVDSLLDMTRSVAHAVERTAAPVTSYILGLAVASGLDRETANARIKQLADNWQAQQQ